MHDVHFREISTYEEREREVRVKKEGGKKDALEIARFPSLVMVS